MKVKITGIHEEDGFFAGVQMKNGEKKPIIGMIGNFDLLPNVVVPGFSAGAFTPDEPIKDLKEVLVIAVQYEELPNDT